MVHRRLAERTSSCVNKQLILRNQLGVNLQLCDGSKRRSHPAQRLASGFGIAP